MLPEDAGGDRLVLRADEAHHARRVLRLDVGAEIVCFDGAGRVWRGRIAAYARDTAVVETTSKDVVTPPTGPRLTLAAGLVKGDRMDAIVQKATELGAVRIVPLATDRSDVRLDERRSAARLDRWRRIVVEASKQCERAWLPEVATPATLDTALEAADGDAIAFVERVGAPARPYLETMRGALAVTIFVGPEGGWSERERALLADRGVAGLTLGPLVLRADTAAIAALAVVGCILEPDDRS